MQKWPWVGQRFIDLMMEGKLLRRAVNFHSIFIYSSSPLSQCPKTVHSRWSDILNECINLVFSTVLSERLLCAKLCLGHGSTAGTPTRSWSSWRSIWAWTRSTLQVGEKERSVRQGMGEEGSPHADTAGPSLPCPCPPLTSCGNQSAPPDQTSSPCPAPPGAGNSAQSEEGERGSSRAS